MNNTLQRLQVDIKKAHTKGQLEYCLVELRSEQKKLLEKYRVLVDKHKDINDTYKVLLKRTEELVAEQNGKERSGSVKTSV